MAVPSQHKCRGEFYNLNLKQMKKVSITAVLIAVATTMATITLALFCYETEAQGQMIDFGIAVIWMGGMLTAYAEQLKYSEKNRVKRWEE